uniref:Uncharacterized protein n=1 Tax=Ditylum brightwellii TaxID=49249 RepID=A0A7S4QJJ7_9STRA
MRTITPRNNEKLPSLSTTKLSSILFQNEHYTNKATWIVLGGAAIGLSAFIPLIMSSSSSSQKYSLKRCISYFPTMLYNTMVVSMTSTWYENVLTQLEDGECILDVGVGTAGTCF